MERESLVHAFNAVGQPTRLSALLALSEHRDGLSVGRLAMLLEVPANTMSTHMAVLARAGLVSGSKSGTTVTYTVDPDAVAELRRFLDRVAGADP